MPLTPDEQRELAALEAEHTQAKSAPSTGGLTPEEKAELAQLQAEMNPPPKEMGGLETLLRTGKSYLSSNTSGIFDAIHGNATGNAAVGRGNYPPVIGDMNDIVMDEQLDGKEAEKKAAMRAEFERQKQFAKEHPVLDMGARIGGAVNPSSVGGAVTKGVGAVTPKSVGGLVGFFKDLVAKPAAGATAAGIQTALDNTAKSQAGATSEELPSVMNNMAWGAAIPLAGQTLSGAKQLVQTSAQGLAGMSDKVAKQYVENRPLVDKYAGYLHGKSPQPLALQQDAKEGLDEALDALSQKGKEQFKEKGQALAGKSFNIPSSTLKDTGIPEVDTELARLRQLSTAPSQSISTPNPVGTRRVGVTLEDAPRELSALEKMNELSAKGVPPVVPNQAMRRSVVEQGLESTPRPSGDDFLTSQAKLAGMHSTEPTGLQKLLGPANLGDPNAKIPPPRPRIPAEAPVPQPMDVPLSAPLNVDATAIQLERLRKLAGRNTDFSNSVFPKEAHGAASKLGGFLSETLNSDPKIAAVNAERSAGANLVDKIRSQFGTQPEKALVSGSQGVQANLQNLQNRTGVPVFDKNLAAQAAKAMDKKSSKNWIGIPVGEFGRAGLTGLYKGQKAVDALSKKGINERNLLLGGLGLLNRSKDEDK